MRRAKSPSAPASDVDRQNQNTLYTHAHGTGQRDAVAARAPLGKRRRDGRAVVDAKPASKKRVKVRNKGSNIKEKANFIA